IYKKFLDEEAKRFTEALQKEEQDQGEEHGEQRHREEEEEEKRDRRRWLNDKLPTVRKRLRRIMEKPRCNHLFETSGFTKEANDWWQDHLKELRSEKDKKDRERLFEDLYKVFVDTFYTKQEIPRQPALDATAKTEIKVSLFKKKLGDKKKACKAAVMAAINTGAQMKKINGLDDNLLEEDAGKKFDFLVNTDLTSVSVHCKKLLREEKKFIRITDVHMSKIKRVVAVDTGVTTPITAVVQRLDAQHPNHILRMENK
ncbi:hypothetical protein HDU96_002753, partial [Phlyctochytrium bullatum]